MVLQRAVFLDRDGTINEDAGFVTKPEQLRLIPYAAKAIALLNEKYKVVVITNQPMVGRGLCTEEDIKMIHHELLRQLSMQDAKLDGIYACFHHPIMGLGEYRQSCSCRKPMPGMILKAADELSLDLASSYMVGDKTSDIKAGLSAGLKTILVKTGTAGNDGFNDAVPDYVAEDLYHAAKIILEKRI